jgi:hypothetical protein
MRAAGKSGADAARITATNEAERCGATVAHAVEFFLDTKSCYSKMN